MFKKLRSFLKKLLNNQRAISSGEVIGLAISFLLFAILGPMAIGAIANMTALNQTFYWNPSVITIFQVVLPIIWVIGVVIRYLPGRE